MVTKNKTNSKTTKKITKEEKTTKKPNLKNDKLLLIPIGVIIACVLALILLPKFVNNNDPDEIETVTYKGFVFEKYGNAWVTQLQVQDWLQGWDKPYEISFHYTPYEVEYIPSIVNSRNESSAPDLIMSAQRIYITTDPKYPASVVLGGVEIAKILGNVYEKDVKSALTKEDNRTNAPVRTCQDIGPMIRVIELRLGNETKIFSENGCIVVQGVTPLDTIKASERLTFELLKIM